MITPETRKTLEEAAKWFSREGGKHWLRGVLPMMTCKQFASAIRSALSELKEHEQQKGELSSVSCESGPLDTCPLFTLRSPEGHLIHTLVSTTPEEVIHQWMEEEACVFLVHNAGRCKRGEPQLPLPSWEDYQRQEYSIVRVKIVQTDNQPTPAPSPVTSSALPDYGHLMDYVLDLHIIVGSSGMCRCGEDGITCSERLGRVSREVSDALIGAHMAKSTGGEKFTPNDPSPVTMPPCDHDECPLHKCMKSPASPSSAVAVSQEEAFEEWWGSDAEVMDLANSTTPKDFGQRCWHAALAWKAKTSEKEIS